MRLTLPRINIGGTEFFQGKHSNQYVWSEGWLLVSALYTKPVSHFNRNSCAGETTHGGSTEKSCGAHKQTCFGEIDKGAEKGEERNIVYYCCKSPVCGTNTGSSISLNLPSPLSPTTTRRVFHSSSDAPSLSSFSAFLSLSFQACAAQGEAVHFQLRACHYRRHLSAFALRQSHQAWLGRHYSENCRWFPVPPGFPLLFAPYVPQSNLLTAPHLQLPALG
mmetsp:Transcript_4260/g.7885  ORF Transcript_4260/g.7885 Transcript_4260/m.7885 type:complete len:220 (-) Transcript_4260:980-1639(-)